MSADSLILMGKIAATHGLRGQLRIVSYSGSFDSFLSIDSVMLKDRSGRTNKFSVAGATVHGNKLLLTLAGFTDINEVLPFVGSELYLRRDQLPSAADDEYYWYDLIGLKVVTSSGEPLGRLESIIETGSNDVFVVKSAEREYLIPALQDVVVNIDLAGGVMTVTPFEGLFDL
jgi:16S rRNA processing protein RimM